MGRFRFLSKPCKRYFFYYADKVANQWFLIVVNKYKLKYINKRKKIGLDNEAEIRETKDSSTIPGLDDFLIELKNQLEQEKSLAHGKVREYWLRRGPRLIMVLVFTIIITIVLAGWLTETSINDHILSILVGTNMLLFNLYMLYQRLIDAISGAMMRIGHDHYTQWKKGLES